MLFNNNKNKNDEGLNYTSFYIIIMIFLVLFLLDNMATLYIYMLFTGQFKNGVKHFGPSTATKFCLKSIETSPKG